MAGELDQIMGKEPVRFRIGSQEIHVKPELTIYQVKRLIEVITKHWVTLIKVCDDPEVSSVSAAIGNSIILSKFLAVLNDEDLEFLFRILIGNIGEKTRWKNPDFTAYDEVSLDIFTQVLALILENNDMGAFLGNVTRAWSKATTPVEKQK